MKIKNRILVWGIIFLFISIAVSLIGSPMVQAQYWTPIPPYNLLWPLWSPVLSPPDPFTGEPTPILSSVTRNTFLPLAPILLWDPVIRDFPYMLYNIPQPLGGGMVFFDKYYGLNPFPPSYLIDPLTNLPAPIDLPVGFGALSPTLLDPFADYVTIANLYYLAEYPPGVFATAVSRLLTTAEIWGLPPL